MKKMKKYILYYNTPEVYVAVYKYELDLREIFISLGYIGIKFGPKKSNKITRILSGVCSFFCWMAQFSKNDQVFYFGPMNKWYKYILDFIAYIKKFNTFGVVTDIDFLRDLNVANKEMKLYKNDKGLIMQNSVMESVFRSYGFKGDISVQNCLDFLITEEMKKKCNNYNKFKINYPIQICFGGNLDIRKAKFVYKLDSVNWVNVEFRLYGMNYQKDITSTSVSYYGYTSPDKLIELLEGDFGLVWDGTEINRCTGSSGQYYKYACPHKLSQYIACRMPVIVWTDSVMAEFVINNNCGICVNSLLELENIMQNMNDEKYLILMQGVDILREKIINGYFMKEALKYFK